MNMTGNKRGQVARSRWPAFTLRKRIFGGFAIILALLAVLAVVAVHGMGLVGAGAGRVEQDSARATIWTDVALQVGEARALVAQYARSATMDDQKAAQESLKRLAAAIDRDRGAENAALHVRANAYVAAVEASIAAVEARRVDVEQLQSVATELRTIVAAIVAAVTDDQGANVARAVADVATTFGTADGASWRYVASHVPADEAAADDATRSLRAAIAKLATAAGDNRRIQRFTKGMAAPLDQFGSALQALVNADEKLRLATVARDAVSQEVLVTASALRGHASTSQHDAISAMRAGTDAARKLSLVTSTGAIGVGLLLAFVIGRSIAGPIMRLTAVMRALADGDLAVTVPHANGRDEVAHMARAVLVFREHMVKEQELAAAGQQEQQRAAEEKRAALAAMADKIEAEMTTALATMGQRTHGLADAADAMSASALRTGDAARTAAASAAQALAGSQTVASAAEQLAASIHEIGAQVGQSTAVVQRAVIAGRETRGKIDVLNNEVARIGRVAEMIGAIAAKTNLLALNATIEAARAGEAGRGFAVVAGEVKLLANQTAQSTHEITDHLAQVRVATAQSVEAVAQIEHTIDEVNAISGSIAAAIEQQQAATSEIARNVSETASAASQMTLRTGDVSNEAENNDHQAASVRDNAGALNVAMEDMRHGLTRIVRTATVEVDRRRVQRHAANLPCRIRIDEASQQPARLLDISEGGAALADATDAPAGAHGVLSLDHSGGEPLPFTVVGVSDGVVHVRFDLAEGAGKRLHDLIERLVGQLAA